MLKFETLFLKLLQSPNFFLSLMIGSLLCFVPILHLFAFGYLFLFTENIVKNGVIAYPEWTDFSNLLIKGLELTAIATLYLLLPFLTFKGFESVLSSVGLAGMTHLFLGLLFILSFPILSSVLFRYQSEQRIASLFNVGLILKMSLTFIRSNILVLITAYGLFQILMPLYGFSIFVSLLFFLSYASIYFTHIGADKA